MKTGHFLGGLALGLLMGGGIGYIMGMDSERKNQMLHFISSKLGLEDCDDDLLEEELMEMEYEAAMAEQAAEEAGEK